jgi:hypothetical protein
LSPPPRANQPPSIPLAAIAAAGRIAFDESDLDVVDAESMAASLCEQKIVRGYLAHSSGLLVLRRTDAFVPPILVDTEAPAA